MKRWLFTAAAALGGLALALTGTAQDPLWPLEQIGAGLRALSLSGRLGDCAAWLLWALLSLLPLLGLLPRGRKRGLADLLFVCAALASFPLWYMLANPGLLAGRLPGGDWALPVARAMLSLLPLILLCGAVTLRCTEGGDAAAFLRRTRALLVLLMCLEAFAAAFALAGGLRAAEPGSAPALAVVRVGCGLAVCVAALATLSAAIDCARAMEPGWFSAEREALRLARRARLLLTVTILAAALSALAGLIALTRGASASVEWSLPMGELLAALACALLARFVAEGARIQRENDSFI